MPVLEGRGGGFFKAREAAYDNRLPKKGYAVVRMDGRAFHTYTKGMLKPFDPVFDSSMWLAADAAADAVQGCLLAYSQSDEISLVYRCGDGIAFGGRAQKLCSITATAAAVAFDRGMGGAAGMPIATFDARLLALDDADQVADYVEWRMGDCRANAVSAVAECWIPKNQLVGMPLWMREEELARRGVDVDDWHMYGRLSYKTEVDRETRYVDKGGVKRSVICLRHVRESSVCDLEKVDDILAGLT